MPRFQRSFLMSEDAREARARFRTELAPSLNDLGYRLEHDAPGVMTFVPRMQPSPFLSGLLLGLAFWRVGAGHQVHATFETQPDGQTLVSLEGQASPQVASQVPLLGRPGHWPADD